MTRTGDGHAARSMTLEARFERLLGRKPSDGELLEVYRVKSALGLDDNDAFLAILLCFQNYRWLLDQYPAQIAKAAEAVLERVRVQAADVARAEIARATRRLTEEVGRAADSVAEQRAARSLWAAKWVTAAVLTVLAGVFMLAGFEFGRGLLPFWMRPEIAGRGVVWRFAGAVLGAPAGWTAYLLLVPVQFDGVRRAWKRMGDEGRSRSERHKAAITVVSIGAGAVAWVALLEWLLGGGAWRF